MTSSDNSLILARRSGEHFFSCLAMKLALDVLIECPFKSLLEFFWLVINRHTTGIYCQVNIIDMITESYAIRTRSPCTMLHEYLFDNQNGISFSSKNLQIAPGSTDMSLSLLKVQKYVARLPCPTFLAYSQPRHVGATSLYSISFLSIVSSSVGIAFFNPELLSSSATISIAVALVILISKSKSLSC